MLLLKENNGHYDLKNVEESQAQELISEGYELAVETDKPSEDATYHWRRITNGWVQVWEMPTPSEGHYYAMSYVDGEEITMRYEEKEVEGEEI